MKKYKVNFYWASPSIRVIDIYKETPAYVFLSGENGRRSPKISPYTSYHDTIEQARAWLAEKIEADMEVTQRRIEQLEAKVARLAEIHEKIATMGAE